MDIHLNRIFFVSFTLLLVIASTACQSDLDQTLRTHLTESAQERPEVGLTEQALQATRDSLSISKPPAMKMLGQAPIWNCMDVSLTESMVAYGCYDQAIRYYGYK